MDRVIINAFVAFVINPLHDDDDDDDGLDDDDGGEGEDDNFFLSSRHDANNDYYNDDFFCSGLVLFSNVITGKFVRPTVLIDAAWFRDVVCGSDFVCKKLIEVI